MKLLHAADLHIDSPLRGLSSYEGAPAEEIRGAARRAVANLVDLALAESVDAVLLAGDIYDGDWKDYHTGLFFTVQMRRLDEAGIPVLLVAGNHDAESRITRELRLPDNVHRFSTMRPDTVAFEDIGLAVHGQGFAIRDVTDNLAVTYPAPRGGMFNVGLLHTALAGAEGHATYAPCNVGDLVSRGYDYWALGHVHAREVVHEAEPWIVFPGNIQGRHARETGPKGATLITVGDDGRATIEHRDLDVVRWARLDVDASGATGMEDVLDLVRHRMAEERAAAGDRLLATRVRVTGATDAHEALWRDERRFVFESRALAGEFPGVWLEKVRLETRHVDLGDAGPELPALVDDLARTAKALRADPSALEQLVRGVPGLKTLDPKVAEEGIAPADAAWRADVFDQAVDLLTAMITGTDGEPA
ncbi:exonuclease SbcCD subunit D [Embleya sp. NBC_00896]|uniref:metallophosphoesterase family protein n=1 Tax=Embleya sp. NBC_00896 TaxID=2975961 RepID=UPI00386EB386|nr:DNA repair exonuclease [Embleya sp. NBC_00896]